MKKTFLVLVVTFSLVLLCACTDAGQPDSQGAPAVTEPPVVTEAPFDYKTLTPRVVREWKDIGLLWSGTDTVLYLEIPSDWEIEKMNDFTYIIYRNGGEIGKITTQLSDTLFDILEEEAPYKKGTIEIEYDVRCAHEEWGDDYRRVFGFWSLGEKMLSVYLDVDYTAMSNINIGRIFESATYGDRNGGEFYLDMDKYNDSNKILLIGNSFVGEKYSAISLTLGQFVKSSGKTEYEFETQIRYGKSIEDYAMEPNISDFRNGKYKAVFMCGIYGLEDVDAMQLAIDACAESNTALVFFPAHNERDERIAIAKERYPDAMFLDWSEEIDAFIDNNHDFWKFCSKDGDLHSTPLAGYIGAHMIYKAVFHEVPPAFKESSYLAIKDIEQFIGKDYMETGLRAGELSYPVYELK